MMLKNFTKNGYHFEKSVTPLSVHEELFFIFYDLSLSAINRKKIKLDYIPKNINECYFPRDIKELDRVLFSLLEYDRDLLGEIYVKYVKIKRSTIMDIMDTTILFCS